ncbi:MAG: gas vesicle protein GvpJ [Terrabacter sp.]
MREQSGYMARPAPSGLAEVIEIVLGKGIVIDAYLNVSALGIQVLTIDARIVVASVDTYLHFAEATNRLDLEEKGKSPIDLITKGTEEVVAKVAADVVEHKIDDIVETAHEKVEAVQEKIETVQEKAADTARQLAVGALEKTREFLEEALPGDHDDAEDDAEDDTEDDTEDDAGSGKSS